MKPEMKVVWVSQNGQAYSMDALDTSHLVNILNMIERGALSKSGRIRTASYRDLVKEAAKRGLTNVQAKVWTA